MVFSSQDASNNNGESSLSIEELILSVSFLLVWSFYSQVAIRRTDHRWVVFVDQAIVPLISSFLNLWFLVFSNILCWSGINGYSLNDVVGCQVLFVWMLIQYGWKNGTRVLMVCCRNWRRRCWSIPDVIGINLNWFSGQANSMENRDFNGRILAGRFHLIVKLDSSESQFRLESKIIVFEIVMKIK
jgi:hypothetical protein